MAKGPGRAEREGVSVIELSPTLCLTASCGKGRPR